MMIERSSIFAVMATMMCISAGTHAAKVSDSLLRGHRRIDEDDCLSITDIICDSDDYTQLCELLKKVDLADALGAAGEWTLFAPNKDALKGIVWDTLSDDQIKDVLLFHTVKGTAINSADLSCSDTIEMGNGDDSRTKCKGGNTYQTGSGNIGMDLIPQIIDQDIEACNGIIHILDGVMLPKLSNTVGVVDETNVNDNDEDDAETEYVMTEHGDYLDPERCYGIVGTCGGGTYGGTQMNFNRNANLLGKCPLNSRCSGNGNCECNKGYCAAADNKCQSIPKPPIEQYKQTVRVRKEWRTLSADERKRVANAFSIMNNTDTLSGRKTYGKHFWNAQDLVILHVCAVVDPRCDQGHFGPSFMTFHRGLLLMIENSLRAIDEEIIAMPYWNMALDSETGIYNPNSKNVVDGSQYIFSDKYFGSYFTEESDNYVVHNGLFAYWAVPEWTIQEDNVYNDPKRAGTLRYGPDSDMGRSSLNMTNPGINKVSTCIARGLFLPAQPGTAKPSENPKSVECTKDCKNSEKGCSCWATDQVQDDETYLPGYNAIGQGANSIPSYCTDECKKDSTKCPLFARADHYSCMPWVQRNPRDAVLSNQFASNTNQITYTPEDFKTCLNPQFVNSWMEWQNCVERRTNGVCEIRVDDEMVKWQAMVGSQTGMAASIGELSYLSNDARHEMLNDQSVTVNADIQNAVDIIAGLKPDLTMEAINGQNRSEYIEGLAAVWSCGNPMGYVDTSNGRIAVNNLHAQGHIRIGLDFMDTGSSAMDMAAFHGHHAHVDMSNMIWMQAMGNEGKARYYGYPTGDQTSKNSNDWIATAGKTPYGTSGPFGMKDMVYCKGYAVSYRYNGTRPEVKGLTPDRYEFTEGGPWINGTTLDEVVSEHFPYFDLYADYDGGDKGYTHRDIIEHSFPDRTDYTYDLMVDFYPNICNDAKDCPPLPKE